MPSFFREQCGKAVGMTKQVERLINNEIRPVSRCGRFLLAHVMLWIIAIIMKKMVKKRERKSFRPSIRNSFCFNARIVLFVKEALRPERPDLLHRDANQTI